MEKVKHNDCLPIFFDALVIFLHFPLILVGTRAANYA